MPEKSPDTQPQNPPIKADWSVYLVRCADGSLYTGISTNVARRLREHECGRSGARRLRGRGPLQLAFECRVGSRSLASRIEYRIKRLPAAEKQDAVVLSRRIERLMLEFQPAPALTP